MSQTFIRRFAWLAAASTFACANLAMAQSTGAPSAEELTKPGAGTPPEQAAIDACKGKKERDRVTFVDAKGKKRKWGCITVDGVLAARSGVATPARQVKHKQ